MHASPFATLVHVTEGRGMPRPYGAFCTRRIHATTASSKIGPPCKQQEKYRGFFNQRASDDPRCRAWPAKTRSVRLAKIARTAGAAALIRLWRMLSNARSSRGISETSNLSFSFCSSAPGEQCWQARNRVRNHTAGSPRGAGPPTLQPAGRWTGSSHGRSLPGLHPGPQPLAAISGISMKSMKA
jgi:hypothetical protein